MIAVLAGLYLLATFDGLFSGICAASGRCALLSKRRYFVRAIWHGIAWAQVASIIGLLLLIGAVVFARDPVVVTDELIQVGQRMLTVYSLYAAIVFLTFAVRTIPSVDIRSMTSTIGFGPLTLIRPAVILGGAGWGIAIGPSLTVVVVTLMLISIMLPFRPFLNWWFTYTEFAHRHCRMSSSG